MRTGQKCHSFNKLSSLISSNGFNDVFYQKYSKGTKNTRDYCNTIWYIFFLKQKIFSLLVWFSEFVRSQVQPIGVTKFQCGLQYTQNLQGFFFFFLKIILMK